MWQAFIYTTGCSPSMIFPPPSEVVYRAACGAKNAMLAVLTVIWATFFNFVEYCGHYEHKYRLFERSSIINHKHVVQNGRTTHCLMRPLLSHYMVRGCIWMGWSRVENIFLSTKKKTKKTKVKERMKCEIKKLQNFMTNF